MLFPGRGSVGRALHGGRSQCGLATAAGWDRFWPKRAFGGAAGEPPRD
jgi:hypothetical protein